jgi:putative OPT family oligopeptide transporter
MSFAAISANDAGQGGIVRTDLDVSMRWLLRILVVLLVVILGVFYSFVQNAPLSPAVGWFLVVFGVFMVFCIGFLTAAACGYMAGLIGSSNSPISGIGVVAVIIVSVLLMGMENLLGLLATPEGKAFGMALALFVTTGVVCSATIANDNLQDLKTGFLLGATPKNQQIALFIGCCVGAVVIAPVLDILYQAYGFSGAALPRPEMNPGDVLSAPQATLMMTIAKGIFAGNLDWSMFVTGIVVGVAVIVVDFALDKVKSPMRLSALAVGLGTYLPASATAAIVVGAILNVLVNRSLRRKGASAASATAEQTNRGVLIASGYIVGESLVGVILAIAILGSISLGWGDAPFSIQPWLQSVFGAGLGSVQTLLSLLVFLLACGILYRKAVNS